MEIKGTILNSHTSTSTIDGIPLSVMNRNAERTSSTQKIDWPSPEEIHEQVDKFIPDNKSSTTAHPSSVTVKASETVELPKCENCSEKGKTRPMGYTYYEVGKKVLESRHAIAEFKYKNNPSEVHKLILLRAELALAEFELEYKFPGTLEHGYFFRDKY